MLHRQFGNLDDVIHTGLPMFNKETSVHKIGIVESVDEKTFVVKVRDCQTGQRGIECVVLQQSFSTFDKSGAYVIPNLESKVVYYMDGGNKGIILGNLIKGVVDNHRDFKSGINANPGFENFNNAGAVTSLDLPSDFGWGPGDQGWVNERGKIKMMRSGIIVIKSGPFCYQYMLPAKQARLSQFMYDEERGIGYIKRRKTFICPLPGVSFNANYKMEQIDDIPSAPMATLREEKGFCDKPTAFNSLNHSSDIDITGHVSAAILSSVEILKARAIRRMTIAKTSKVQGQRVFFEPVYKKEERIDGTVVEQCGHTPGSPFYNLEIVKSPLGYMHIIGRTPVGVPTAMIKLNALLGSVEIYALNLSYTSPTSITFKAPEINLEAANVNITAAAMANITSAGQVNINAVSNANLQAGGVLNMNSLVSASLNAPITSIDAQASMSINAPMINSLPTPVPITVVPAPPVGASSNLFPPVPIPLPIVQDNTFMDESPVSAD